MSKEKQTIKQATTILLLIILLMQTFSRFVIEADYSLNKKFIAYNLCVNKNKPSMNCCGKCYLKKQLTKDGKQQSPAANKKERNELQYTLSKGLNINPSFVRAIKTTTISRNVLLFSAYEHSVFHPPCV